jgi:hypothetical protein
VDRLCLNVRSRAVVVFFASIIVAACTHDRLVFCRRCLAFDRCPLTLSRTPCKKCSFRSSVTAPRYGKLSSLLHQGDVRGPPCCVVCGCRWSSVRAVRRSG